MFGRRESLVEVIREESATTRELIRSMREESAEESARYREESREREERLQALTEETREFNREILLRNEKVYTSVIAEMEEGRKQLEEGRKQIQANTQAVLSVLDRLNGSSGTAAA